MTRYRYIVDKIDQAIMVLILLVSLLVVSAIVIDYGFVLNELEQSVIDNIYTIGWWSFLVSFTLQFIFNWTQIRRKALSVTSLLGFLLYLPIFPKYIPIPEDVVWLNHIWNFLGNNYFLISLLGIFSVIELSRGITRFVNKKTNPALLTVVCFAVIIAFGALLLLLPRSTMEHIQLPVIDALFTSMSAVCVTGLSTVDVANTFTLEGQIIIALLIQIGGLGIMTITTFFAVFFMDGLGLYSQFALKDMLSSDAESLMSTLLHVLGFTIIIEMIGAFFIWLSVHPMEAMTLDQEIFFAIFHSVSAFCNAGFSTLEGGLGNSAVFGGHNLFYVVISLLIVFGGIGFPILINIKKQLSYYLTKLFRAIFQRDKLQTRYSHLVSVNSKMVLCTTLILILFGAVSIAICEWNGAFAGMPVGEKIVQSFFNSIVPRTAGFNSVTTSEFSRITIFLLIFLMWVGGASQSTAGGIKVNTLAVAFASIKSLIKGEQRTEIFNREITYNTVRRTLVVIVGSIFVILLFFVGLLISEPEMPAIALLFETVSAFSTVGSSLGVTTDFNNTSKILLILLMFIGRIGFITVMMSFIPRREPKRYQLPKEDIIIN